MHTTSGAFVRHRPMVDCHTLVRLTVTKLRVKSLRLHVKNFHCLQFFVPVGTPIGSEFCLVVFCLLDVDNGVNIRVCR